jgi:hypothetical protein
MMYNPFDRFGGRRSPRLRLKERRRLYALTEALESRCLLAITGTTPVPISPTEMLSFSGPVLHFTANDAGPFTATITWGDTTVTPATSITPLGGGSFAVNGTHTYSEDGPYALTVIVNDAFDMTSTSGPSSAAVGEQLLSLSAQNFSLPEASSVSVLVATASDPGSPDPGTSYTAMIDWGDGTAPTAGTVTATGGGNFNITGSHADADEGTHSVRTTFLETAQAGFGTLSVSGTGTVTEADVLNNGAITLPAGTVEGQVLPATTQIATFSDPGYPTNSASDFNALINWGDGSPATAGTVVALGGGNFGVQGGHTYKEEGPYNVAVMVNDDAPGTASITITGSVDILNAPLIGSAVAIHGTEGAPLTNVDVATFVDTDPLGDPNDLVATINWGDGFVTAGTVVQDAQIPPGGGTMFHVQGSHTYTEELATTYPVSVTITDRGDGDMWPLNSPFVTSTTVASTAQIVQSPLLPVANSLVSTEGTAIPAGTQLATFTDTGGADAVGDYSATLNWGEGSGVHPASVIALGQGNFAVVSNGAFTYPDEGVFALTISVTDSDTTNNPGNVPTTATTTATATVKDAALTATATQPVIPVAGTTLNEGSPFSGAVATFTDGNAAATTADYTALIDWGDGTGLSLGTFSTGAGGTVTVNGTHTYKQDGAYAVKVAISDDGGETLNTTTTAVVGDPNLTGATARALKAVEGVDTGLVYIASFVDPDPNATLHDWNALVHWGDGSPDETGTLIIAGGDPATGGTIFKVLANHTYAEEGPPSAPTVTLTDVDTPANAPTVLPLNVTVVDAPLSSTHGAEITGVEGVAPAAASLLGTFTDANQAATAADFTSGGGSVVVNWGDGSAPQTLAASNLTSSGSPSGIIWSVAASHTYPEEGTYAYSVTVTDDGGATTTFIGSAIIADAALTPAATQPSISTTEAALFPVPVFAPPLFTGPVASFTDANPASTVADFRAKIDWGDGTPLTAGTVSQPGGAGTAYVVSGSHTYADSGVNGGSGTFTVQVFVSDDGGSKVTVTNTASVADNPIVLTGQLNPKSDSGLSTGTPNVTNVRQPDFYGKSEPFSHVTLDASLLPNGPLVPIGQVQAGSDGSWNIKSTVPLADGHYSITATAVDQFGVTTGGPVAIDSNLLIDTVGPVIAGMYFNRLNGQVDYIIKDPVNPNGSAPSGVWVRSLLDSSNYLFTTVHPSRSFTGKFLVTNVAVGPDPTIPFAYDVAVTLNGGAIIPGGYYLFTIRGRSNGNSSVQDLAENHLDGVFYGSFPSGNGINGSDFVAELVAIHNKVFAPQSIIGTASPGNNGNGGLPVGAVHSGIFVPIVPRGGAPIFSTPTSPSNGGDPPAVKTKGQTVVQAKYVQSSPSSNDAKPVKLVATKNHPKGPTLS